jgi:hypothetical protein
VFFRYGEGVTCESNSNLELRSKLRGYNTIDIVWDLTTLNNARTSRRREFERREEHRVHIAVDDVESTGSLCGGSHGERRGGGRVSSQR